MRLLSTSKLEFKTFPDRDGKTPAYAILSHTWSTVPDEEVLYHDILNGTAIAKKAYPKLDGAMQQARSSYDWIWVDTCCIDKTSSAELSEAINTMYSWYENADTCLAYLQDKAFCSVSEIVESNWFTRGWTLQELIAPNDVLFFDRHWTSIGSKKSSTIYNAISERTKVGVDILLGATPIQSVSVAQRMSWAAGRKTTRAEDMAYCLMGIFGVNMPMLYGEGGKNAFHRLQEQIMKDSNDHTIFAWTSHPDAKIGQSHGLLADDPHVFANAGNFVGYNDWEDAEPFQPSNRGLRINFHLEPTPPEAGLGENTFYAALNVPVPSQIQGYHGFVAIILQKLDVGVKQYTRIRCHEVRGMTTRSGYASTVYVRQKAQAQDHEALTPYHFMMPRRLMTPQDEYVLDRVACYPLMEQHIAPRPLLQAWLAASSASAFQVIKRAGKLAAILYFQRKSDGAWLSVLLGSRTNLEVGFTALAGFRQVSNLTEAEQGLQLYPSGTTIEAGNHFVRIDVEVKVDMPRKLYFLDLTIHGRPRTPPPPLIPEVVYNTVDFLADTMLDTVIGAAEETQQRARAKSVSRRGISFRRADKK